MVRPTRRQQIPHLQEAIKDTAWNQIAETGAATLSLRAIARELGITAPAIYNYFSDRDALVTALIVDAYTSLGESQMASISEMSEEDLKARFVALGLAYREWAVTYPQRYQLIFGTPIPNYVAPDDITFPAAAHAIVPLATTLQALYATGQLHPERLAPMTPELKSMLENWQKMELGADLEVLYLTMIVWSRVHGMSMLEIGHHVPSVITDPGEIFRREIVSMLLQYL
ncbi:MAG: TetR/AcrR family transcriptional regulator [Chloroflexi bacterium]|nr:TetR/AcrR family transcriptional regulator [Chloroflexota bacterium]